MAGTSALTRKDAEDAGRAACIGRGNLFLHPLFDESPTALTFDQRRQVAALSTVADGLCLECPLASQCLYQAVVRHDVAGFVAGTTPGQRRAMRARLNWAVTPESFDAFAGITVQHQIDHDEVVRMRRARPSDTLQTLAARLGCSLSTVKRHLRQARIQAEARSVRPRLVVVPPSMEQVFDARRAVVARRQQPVVLRQAA